MKSVSKLCFIVAMPAEAAPLIDHFGLKHIEGCFGKLPPLAYCGHYKAMDIAVVVNGQDHIHNLNLVGSQPATLAAHLAIEKFNPDLLISAGTAGAFASNGAAIGDTYLSHKHVIFHDRRIPIPGWDAYGVGHYPTYDTSTIAQYLGLKQGVVTTGNSLDMPTIDEQTIKANGGEVKEMEAAAIAWVAAIHDVPFFCIKAITDLMDSDKTTQEEFLENLHTASLALKDACFKVVDFVGENGI
jgi:Nucleoside phosphorylase